MTIDNYKKGQNSEADREFAEAASYGRVKLGADHIYYKSGLSWRCISCSELTGVYRRVEEAKSSLGCCGGVNFDIQKLVLTDKGGETMQVLIGDGKEKEAEAIFAVLKERYPGWNFKKPGAAAKQ